MRRLEEEMKGVGMTFEGWREAAQKAGRWYRREEGGTEAFMHKHGTTRRGVERQGTTRNGLQPQHGPMTPTRGGRGERRVLPKRPKSGSGHHCHHMCHPGTSCRRAVRPPGLPRLAISTRMTFSVDSR